MLKNKSNRHYRKLYNIIYKEISLLKKPTILEFGVSNEALSTEFFLGFCKLNGGMLYSVDINDYNNKFKSTYWKFINSRDDNFAFVDKHVPNLFNIIYLDTLHKADHIEKIFYYYYPKLAVGGYFLIDDISWLPYVKGSEKEQFYMERNHEESFNRVLEIFYSNRDNFDLEFSFIGTGVAKINKLNNNILRKPKKIFLKKYTIFNLFRKFVKIIKK
jgi:hypothetical protein